VNSCWYSELMPMGSTPSTMQRSRGAGGGMGCAAPGSCSGPSPSQPSSRAEEPPGALSRVGSSGDMERSEVVSVLEKDDCL
jgi:hypothetical protein